MNKRYYLKNENGEILDINDLQNSVFNLTSDLGSSRNLTFSRVGEAFIKNTDEPVQKKIEGIITFIKDESNNEINYSKYEKFIKTSEKLTFVNIRAGSNNSVEYCIDMDYAELGKQLKNGYLISSRLTCYCKTNWYKPDNLIYTIEDDEEPFGFPFDFVNMRFSKGNENIKIIENIGYSKAPFRVILKGPILNPKIENIQNNKTINSIDLQLELTGFEELEYCTRDDELILRKINEDGSETNLFDILDANNKNNFFKLPIRGIQFKGKC